MKINFTETILKSFSFTDTKIERTVKATLYIKYEYDGSQKRKFYVDEYGEEAVNEKVDSSGNTIVKESSDFGKETYEYKYDDNNQISYKKICSFANEQNGGWSSISEIWIEYNSMGQEIHYKSSDGFEYWTEYDDRGYIKSTRENNGEESYFETDSHGYIIHQINNDKTELWFQNDDKGNVLYEKDSSGNERRFVYNSSGKPLYTYEKNGKSETFIENEYDSDGRIISEIWYKVTGK